MIENNIYFQNIYKFLATPAHRAKNFRGGHSLVRGGHGHPGPPPKWRHCIEAYSLSGHKHIV